MYYTHYLGTWQVQISYLGMYVGRQRERERASCRLIQFWKVDSRIDATVNYSLLHVIIILLRFSFGPSSSNAINARGYHKNKTTNASSVHNREKKEIRMQVWHPSPVRGTHPTPSRPYMMMSKRKIGCITCTIEVDGQRRPSMRSLSWCLPCKLPLVEQL